MNEKHLIFLSTGFYFSIAMLAEIATDFCFGCWKHCSGKKIEKCGKLKKKFKEIFNFLIEIGIQKIILNSCFHWTFFSHIFQQNLKHFQGLLSFWDENMFVNFRFCCFFAATAFKVTWKEKLRHYNEKYWL